MKIVIHYTKKSAAVASAVMILTIGAIVVTVTRNDNTATAQRIVTPSSNVAPRQADEGPVDVKVTHETKQSTEKTHIFTVVLDTHSGDLSTFDAQTNIVYRPTEGNEALPTAIGGDREGHHRTIITTFNNTTLPGTLAVKNLRSIPERTFPVTL